MNDSKKLPGKLEETDDGQIIFSVPFPTDLDSEALQSLKGCGRLSSNSRTPSTTSTPTVRTLHSSPVWPVARSRLPGPRERLHLSQSARARHVHG